MKKLLLLDDDVFFSKMLEKFLKVNLPTLQTSVFQNAYHAIEFLESEGGVDYIVSDFHMPTMDGLSFFFKIKDRYPESLKVLISSFLTPQLVKEARSLGVSYFFNKPFSFSYFLEVLYTTPIN